jgi:Ni/Co efflux regulator RcnB
MNATSRLLIGTSLALALLASGAMAEPRQDKADRYPVMRIDGSDLDLRQVRGTLLEHRQLLGAPSALPPGIRKNLARGKPLPPGIARRMDDRLLAALPRYDEYEWRQVGRDVVLVAITTGVVEAILRNVLD